MLGWPSTLATVSNVVAVALFVLAYRASTLDRVRRLEQRALFCVVVAGVLAVLDMALALVALSEALGTVSIDPSQDASSGQPPMGGVVSGVGEILLLLLLPIIPFTAWLGIRRLRRRRTKRGET